MQRILLSIEGLENMHKCINGYYIGNSNICTCYLGWTTDPNSFNQCDINTGENSTIKKENHDNIMYPDSVENYNFLFEEIRFKIGLAIFVLITFFCVLLCIFKKCKVIKKINKRKEKNKNKRKTSEISLELGTVVVKEDEDEDNEGKLYIKPKQKGKTKVNDNENALEPTRKNEKDIEHINTKNCDSDINPVDMALKNQKKK